MKHLAYISLAVAAVGLFFSCGNSDSWSIKGQLQGQVDTTLTVEAFNYNGGNWYVLDTVAVSGNGKFDYSHKRGFYNDFYRLRYGDKTIYFPIDSTETVEVEANVDNFDRGYKLSGSESAVDMMTADQLIAQVIDKGGVAALDTATSMKARLTEIIMKKPASATSFYLVSRVVEGTPIYNPTVRSDRGIIGAVANAFSTFRPGDPRTKGLEQYFLGAQKNFGTHAERADTIQAQQISLIDLSLPDAAGKPVTLAQTVAKNRVVVLNFTDYNADFSGALNIELRKIYDAYHAQGLQVYQIGLGRNEYQWRMVAQNQPWVTVYQSLDSKDLQQNLARYNVGQLPALFIINNGEISQRVTNPSQLASSVARYF